ncbi:hypothetical protein P389DRAFT_199089 [Cystobasidium minutum MCA 4210]|uniref:uncharacterized protein n=1 Tax=Cystobasidium minutum MCA 4210 TaxID=1397322 RepID=UPI0034CDB176|eukprot:jgi/Rhomi1/199089/gm1.7303_g
MASKRIEVEDEHPKFKDSTIHAIFQTAYKSQPPLSISTPALTLATELVRLFTMEAIHRSAATAHKDETNIKEIGNSARLDVNHLHKNAAALTLDFGG